MIIKKRLTLFFFKNTFFIISFFVLVSIFTGCASKITPVQLGMGGKYQLFKPEYSVYGIRANLFTGKNKKVVGIDFAGLMNKVTEDAYGIQISGIGNRVKGNFTGIQISGIGNRVGQFRDGSHSDYVVQGTMSESQYIRGIQIGSLLNFGNIYGIQIGYQNGANYIAEKFKPQEFPGFVYGLQLGGLNNATIVRGAQLGIMNFAEDLKGIQIGLWNSKKNGISTPLINIGW